MLKQSFCVLKKRICDQKSIFPADFWLPTPSVYREIIENWSDNIPSFNIKLLEFHPIRTHRVSTLAAQCSSSRNWQLPVK